jgi:hypothetical protein
VFHRPSVALGLLLRCRRLSEIQPRAYLAGAVSGIFTALDRGQFSKLRTVDDRDGRGEVRVIRQVGKCAFQAMDSRMKAGVMAEHFDNLGDPTIPIVPARFRRWKTG